MKKYSFKTFTAPLLVAAMISIACDGSAKAKAKVECDVPVLKGSGIVKMDKFAFEQVRAMKTGWNLGNTFDATSNIDHFKGQNAGISSVSSWGMPEPKKEVFDAVAKAGFKCVRIPVSWSNHLCDKEYTVDPSWMAKVKESVDWAISDGLIVIINIHHDNSFSESEFKYGRGFFPTNKCYAESEKFVVRIWEQICAAFKDYPETQLVFETLNEPRLRYYPHEWNFNASCNKCKEAMNCINNLNQRAVDTIRAGGGANEKRLIMVPSIAASPSAAIEKAFRIPDDPSRRIAVSTHAYAPFQFAMQKKKAGGQSKFTDAHKAELDSMFHSLNSRFVSKGIPVVMGEYGATNKDNIADREEWTRYYVGGAKKYNICCVLWDNNSPKNPDESERFGFLNRNTCEWYFPTLIEETMKVFE
ncbi:glycoside hydrolase family 5 protein [Treponema sp.]|uniref:glycoside hydrolase family 5 protein n=1 Tax=Treponema sp. TaxID=166 RepID=UPI00388D381A